MTDPTPPPGLIEESAELRRQIAELRLQVADPSRGEALVKALLDEAANAIHWVDAKGTIIWATKAELAMLGYSADEYIGRPIADFHVDRARVGSILTRLATGETIHNAEASLRCKDGSLLT